MRETELDPTAGASITAPIALIRDERRRIKVTGMDTSPLILTIAADPAAAPIIEIPGTGSFDLHPAAIQILTEGARYDYNIWTRDSSSDLVQIASGELTIGPSIAPVGVDQATTWLNSGAPVMTMTRAAYNALVTKVPGAIYVVTEA
ncbi:phage upper tail fiber protein [Gemmobacter serpentinus]|uniref:phage upper tail fiber protein n=1 Tax=Gemmobacter serpentinus TaxID=2652247 RepID=UPI00124BCC54|nr:hypothetical protein [Gemmobacter serpentinus]